MTPIISVATETFRLLRRDRIFLPAAITGALLLEFAHLASEFGIEDYSRIMFDIGSAGFHLTGAIVAILWGSKIVSDSRTEGSVEVQLASPMSRTSWIVGKYIGLAMALLFLSLIFTAMWQIVLGVNEQKVMSVRQVIIFGYLTLGWLVLASASIFFSSFCSSSVALFCSVSSWALGLTVAAIDQALPPGITFVSKQLVHSIAVAWDLQRFNLSHYGMRPEFPSHSDLTFHGLYGILAIFVLITSSAIIFNKRDLIG